MQIVTLICIPFMPGILLYQIAKKSEKICTRNSKLKDQLESEEELHIEKVTELTEQSTMFTNEERRLKNIYIMFTKCELFEVLLQSCITIVLLSMKVSAFSLTSSPLEGICGGIDWFLPISLILSLKKLLGVSIKVQEMNKDGFQNFLGMIIYGVYALVASFVRVCSIVLYFSVFIGLYNLLAHFQYETKGFQWQEDSLYSMLNKEVLPYDTVFLANLTSQTNEPISVTKYTGLTMKNFYVIFLVGMMVHFLVMFVKDVIKSTKMKKYYSELLNEIPSSINHCSQINTSEIAEKMINCSWFASLLRAFTSYVIPEVSTDWDENIEFDVVKGAKKNIIEVCNLIYSNK